MAQDDRADGYRCVRIHYAIVFACPEGWRNWDTRRNPLRDFDLWTVIHGRGTLETGGQSFALAPGDVFLLRPGGHYRASQDPEHPLTIIPVHFSFVDGEGRPALPPERFLPGLHRRIRQFGFFEGLLERIVANHNTGRRAEAEFWLGAALRELCPADADPHPTLHEAERHRRIQSLCEKIIRAPEQPWQVRRMAAGLNLSPEHFSRVFKACKGIAAKDFIIQARIEKARFLLRNTDQPLADIASALGYRDAFFFSRQFKARNGCAPLAFRKHRTTEAR